MKRTLASLLCVLLALALPLSALAQSADASWWNQAWEAGSPIATILTLTPGEALAKEPAVADLCDALSLRIMGQKDGLGALSLLLGGEEAVTVAFRVEKDGLYLQSDALHDKALYFPLAGMYLGASAAQEAQAAATASPSETAVPNPLLELYEALDIDTTGLEFADPEAWKEAYRAMGLGEDFVQWAAEWQSRAVVTKGDFTDPSHDPAIVKYDQVLTEKEVAALCRLPFMRDLASQLFTLTDPTLSPQEVAETIDERLAEIIAALESSPFELHATSLYAQDGLVSYSYPYSFSLAYPGSSQSARLDIPLNYRRLTTGDARTHTFQAKVSTDSVDRFSLDAVAIEKGEHWDYKVTLDDFVETAVALKGRANTAEGTFSLAAVVNGEDAFLLETVSASGEGEERVDMKLSLPNELMKRQYGFKPSASSTGNFQHLLTLHVRSAALREPGELFTKLREATPENSILPQAMTEDELQEAFLPYVMRAVFKTLGLMPVSFMELLAEEWELGF